MKFPRQSVHGILYVFLMLGCSHNQDAATEAAARSIRTATAFLKQGLPREALTYADTAINEAPQRPEGYFLRGQAHYVLGNMEGARAAWETASSLDPRNWAWWQSLGDAAFQLADYSASLEYYQRSLRIHPDPVSWHGAAGAYWKMNEPAAARHACKNAVALDTTYAPAYLSLSMMAEHDGQLDDALRQALRAVALAPEFVPALASAGRLKRLAGRPREAIVLLHQALQAAPDNQEVRYNLAQAYYMIGQPEEADTLLQATSP